jgi:hypothetical protein
VAPRRDRIACRRFHRRNRLVTRELRESSVGSSNCLLPLSDQSETADSKGYLHDGGALVAGRELAQG